jgi:hypothetical protein
VSIEQEHREPDQWERVHFVHGLASLFSGAYSLAACEADLALTPPGERSPTVKLPADPLFDRCDIARLRRVLAAAQAESVREFPSFGPIVITGEDGKWTSLRRSKGAAIPHDRARHPQAHGHGAAAGERLCDDPPARGRRRYRDQAWQPQFPGNGHHRLSQDGGTLEEAAAMANHAPTRTTQLYDRGNDKVSLEEVERILIWRRSVLCDRSYLLPGLWALALRAGYDGSSLTVFHDLIDR